MERLKFIGKRLVYLVIMLFGVATWEKSRVNAKKIK